MEMEKDKESERDRRKREIVGLMKEDGLKMLFLAMSPSSIVSALCLLTASRELSRAHTRDSKALLSLAPRQRPAVSLV